MSEPASVVYEGMFTRAGGFKPGGGVVAFIGLNGSSGTPARRPVPRATGRPPRGNRGEHSGTGLEAVVNFASTHIQVNDWDELIARCQEQKAIAIKEEEDYRALFENGLDTHPF